MPPLHENYSSFNFKKGVENYTVMNNFHRKKGANRLIKLTARNIKMRYTFADKIFPDIVIKDIENIVYDFAYKKTKMQLHYESWTARQCSLLMPTPISWKAFITNRCFDYSKYLNGGCIIDIDSVKSALELINWNRLRKKRCPLCRYTRITTKSAMRRGLDNVYIRNNIIKMIWMLLSTCTVDDFRVRAHKGSGYAEYCRIPTFTHPLSRYFPPQRDIDGIVSFLLDFNIINAGV